MVNFYNKQRYGKEVFNKIFWFQQASRFLKNHN